ncbi:hypothetical protein WR25_04782 [Diploscapter pachys]|uniref:EB domain-containing protein n=1 Tax=Diploscapter pachys TaxID=2018661 RepID=A0A2A2L4J6_9BILA|nr:hypothetical protein WR25_04782 [Diploscapter pachys]
MNLKLFILAVLHNLSLACQINYECPRNQYCGSDGYCHPMGSAYRSCYFQTDCMSTETCANNRCVPKSYIQSSNKDCTISLQCSTAETCQNGRCVTTMMGNMPGGGASGCLVDSQCWNKDEKCVNGQCQIVLGSLTTRINICQYDSECPSGQSCIQSRCSTSTCKTDRDCRNTDICVMGSCVEVGLATNYENRFNSQKKTIEKYGPASYDYVQPQNFPTPDPYLTIERTCGVNEVFVSCRSSCEPTCVDPNRVCQ